MSRLLAIGLERTIAAAVSWVSRLAARPTRPLVCSSAHKARQRVFPRRQCAARGLFRGVVASAVLLVVASSQPCWPADDDTVTATLRSGRKFTARVDRRSNDRLLLLQFSGLGASVFRPINWSEVVTVEESGKVVPGEEFRRKIAALSSESPRSARSGSNLVIRNVGGATSSAPRDLDDVRTDLARRAPSTTPVRLQTIRFDACVTNWDGDVETDGLLVRLAVLDANGGEQAVDGILDVEWVAMRRASTHLVPYDRIARPERVARWTVALAAKDFPQGTASVLLPFQAAHPEADVRWSNYGLVHVRLIVPGQGIFEHSLDAVRTRPWSPLRDALERQDRERRLPSEGPIRQR